MADTCSTVGLDDARSSYFEWNDIEGTSSFHYAKFIITVQQRRKKNMETIKIGRLSHRRLNLTLPLNSSYQLLHKTRNQLLDSKNTNE